ncbi:hypothetical protein ACQ4M3_09700 [Leptolyngbya sp. AN03gr2]|uniref:hypothetical protein n=1 Tax=Leptolyngbya sp. AN03gr2 TaxID=3423364 RepID=UPI003D314701
MYYRVTHERAVLEARNLGLTHLRTAKTHHCETEAVAQLVLQDLNERGVEDLDLYSVDADLFIDFGGSISFKPAHYKVPDVPCGFFLQHYDYVRKEVNKAKNRGGYYKLHGYRFAVCLSEDSFETFKSWLIEHEKRLLEEAAAEIEDLAERFAEIKKDAK